MSTSIWARRPGADMHHVYRWTDSGFRAPCGANGGTTVYPSQAWDLTPKKRCKSCARIEGIALPKPERWLSC